jgi:hypothetical protein
MLSSKLPTIRLSGTSSGMNSPYTPQQQPQLKKKKNGNWLKSGLEILGFLTWLGLTGYAGYYIGYDPSLVKCPENSGAGPAAQQQQMTVAQDIIESARMPPCPEVEEEEETDKTGGNSGKLSFLHLF